MKTLSQICQLVKTEYEEALCYDEWEQEAVTHSGLCSAVRYLVGATKLSLEDKERFMTEYKKSIKNRRIFYYFDGEKSNERGLFAWKISNRPARIKWLDQRI